MDKAKSPLMGDVLAACSRFINLTDHRARLTFRPFLLLPRWHDRPVRSPGIATSDIRVLDPYGHGGKPVGKFGFVANGPPIIEKDFERAPH
jgi:hypothetical protein